MHIDMAQAWLIAVWLTVEFKTDKFNETYMQFINNV